MKAAAEELAEEGELEDEGEKQRWGPLRERGGRGAWRPRQEWHRA